MSPNGEVLVSIRASSLEMASCSALTRNGYSLGRPTSLRRSLARPGDAHRLEPSLGGRGALAALHKILVGEDAYEDDRSHHRKIERARDAEQVDEVLQHLEQYRPENNADDRALATAERAAAKHSGGDGVELVERAVHRRRD